MLNKAKMSNIIECVLLDFIRTQIQIQANASQGTVLTLLQG